MYMNLKPLFLQVEVTAQKVHEPVPTKATDDAGNNHQQPSKIVNTKPSFFLIKIVFITKCMQTFLEYCVLPRPKQEKKNRNIFWFN